MKWLDVSDMGIKTPMMDQSFCYCGKLQQMFCQMYFSGASVEG